MGLLLCFTLASFAQIKRKGIYIIGGTGLLCAAADELIQRVFDGRSGSIKDIIIDFSGLMVGIFLTALLINFLRKVKEHPPG